MAYKSKSYRSGSYKSKAYKPRKNAKSSIVKLSDFTYGLNKTLRDLNAIEKGKIGGRIERRILGKIAAKGLGSEFLKFFRK